MESVFTAKVAVAGVALVSVLPLSTAVNPTTVPPAEKPPTGPAGMVVGWLPVAMELTAKLKVQVPVVVVARGTLPPDSWTSDPFAGTDAVLKPQVSTTFGVDAMVTPVGKLRVIAALVRPFSVLSLKSEIVSVSASPGLMVAGLYAKLTVAAACACRGDAKNRIAKNP